MEKDKKYIKDNSLKERKGGFQIPENYMDDFESHILQKLGDLNEVPKSGIINLKTILLASIPIAAMLVLGYFLFLNSSIKKDNNLIESELRWDEYASFEEDWITEELAVVEDQETDMDLEINYLLEEGVTNIEIIEAYNEIP